MLNFFEVRGEGRLHPTLYRAVLGGFALARLWEGAPLRGPERGRSFEAVLYEFCDRADLPICERAGSRTLCNTTSASGLRHESDGVITAADVILHVETKHLTNAVSKNDLMVFNQKGLDFALTGDARIRSRPLYRLFISGAPLSCEARRFALLWGIITVEPDLFPLPILHWLAGSTFPAGQAAKGLADRIWREVPVLVAPLQERVQRLPAGLLGATEPLSFSRLEWALKQLQDGAGTRWWQALDSHDPFWLERVYAELTQRRLDYDSTSSPIQGTPWV